MVIPFDNDAAGLEERLERGHIVVYQPCPFPLVPAGQRDFLFAQRIRGAVHKNISFHPQTRKCTGFVRQAADDPERLAGILGHFADHAEIWLAGLLPRYARAWKPDRVSFRPDEEATRKLRLTARNDLLHIDAYPSRPTAGRRILRLFVNLSPVDERVWATSETLAELLDRFGPRLLAACAGMAGWVRRFRDGIGRLLQRDEDASDYDQLMLRLHHAMKRDDDYQERAPKKFWRFPPESAWLFFSDGLSHADLRGRYLLDFSFFIPQETLLLPHLSPAALMHQHRAQTNSHRAA